MPAPVTLADRLGADFGTVTNPIFTSGGGGGSTAVATVAAPTYVEGSDSDLSLTLKGALRAELEDPNNSGAAVNYPNVAGRPYGSTFTAASATGAAGAIAPALSTASAKTTYVEKIIVTGGGATGASVIAVTLTGLTGGTQTFSIAVPAGATLGITPLNITFDPPMPASATNTAITLNVPSFGAGNTASNANIVGFYV